MKPARPFDRVLQGELPLPLSLLYTRVHHAKGARDRHDHAFHLVEAALKLAAAALVGRYRTLPRAAPAAERSERVDAALRRLALPSLGQWRDIFRETLLFLGKRPGADSWSQRILEGMTARREGSEATHEVLSRVAGLSARRRERPALLDLIDLLPAYRNSMSDAHGSIKADPGRYLEGTGALLELANSLLRDAPLLGGGRLVYSEEVHQERGGERRVVWIELTGPAAIRRQPYGGEATGAGILPGELHLEISPAERLSLHPLIFYQAGELSEQVYFLNRAREGKGGVQFLSYATGDFYHPGKETSGDGRGAGLVEDLERLLSWITAGPVDAERFEELKAESLADSPAPDRDAPVAATKADDPHRILGDFEILGELGRGGMAVVYQARQRSLDRLVALKVLPHALKGNAVAVARFQQEVRALARCDHPNVIKVFSSGEAEDTCYYAMELVDGADLGAVIQELRRAGTGRRGGERARLLESDFESAVTRAGGGSQGAGATPSPDRPAASPPRGADPPAARREPLEFPADRDINFRFAALIRDAARGAQHLHEHGIIHRDLKPQNIMITRDRFEPVVMDLGLAKLSGISQSLTIDKGRTLGTLRYMAPEQLQRQLLEVDARSDVYALGVVLYELVCGRPMLDGDTEERLTAQLLFEEPPPPRKVNPALPTDLATIIVKATRKDPRERYLSAAEIAEDLDRFVHGTAIHAQPFTLGYLLRVQARRHWKGIAAASISLLLLVAALIGGSWYLRAEKGRQLREVGLAHSARFGALQDELTQLESAWKESVEKHRPSDPVWERGEEIEAHRRLAAAEREVDQHYNQAVIDFSSAIEVAPGRSSEALRAKQSLEALYWSRFREARREGGVTFHPEFFKTQIGLLGTRTHARELEGRGRITIRSHPPGATVHCFRYENREERLVPLPFDPAAGRIDPAKGLLGDAFLLVERILDSKLSPFQEGDRLLRAGETDLHVEGDLAKALAPVGKEEPVVVQALRGGKKAILSWIPFPAERYGKEEGPFRPGRLLSSAKQLGFLLAGYPLDFVEGSRLGITEDQQPLEVEMPQGSYLLVFRKEGYADTRFPIAIPDETGADEADVRLLRPSEIPPGFLYVPKGPLLTGTDRAADKPLMLGVAPVEGFFIKRLEVTIGEYLEFLNDPEVFSRTSESGEAPPLADWEMEGIHGLLPPKKPETRVLIVPSWRNRLFFTRAQDASRWSCPSPVDSPVPGLSFLAGLEYAAWLSIGKGKPWRYRLPTDLEWEKAARGADRRVYVWGDYPIWGFCCSAKGTFPGQKSQLARAGSFPADESVFGVRDLAGSLREPAIGRTDRTYSYCSQRGGDWTNPEDLNYRIANRNGRPPGGTGSEIGLRIVAELEPAKE